MAEFTQEELMAKVLEVLATKDKMKNKEIATILDVKKKDVDVAVNALAMEG
jgi:Mn-dependent DtxR family transcriptional regulator